MNPDRKLGLNQKTKLLFQKDAVTSQIVDYYNRFGQNRDLEQYLTFSNTAAGRRCPSIQSDTTSNFSTARCLLTDSENHSICARKEVAPHNLTDSDSDDKHTVKYLMKPPELVHDYRERPSTSGTSQNETKKEISIKFDSKTKFAIGDSDLKSDESSHEVISAREDVNQNLDNSLNKAGSPTSSITSRKLEWDSLADVGYANVGQNKNPHQNLSTLERMALDGHLKSGNNTKRSDRQKRSTSNETSTQLPNFSQVGSPDAQSTPIQVSQTKSPVSPVKRKSILRSSPRKYSSDDSNIGGRASSKERHHRIDASNLNSGNLKIDMTKHFSINVDISNVDENRGKVLSDGNIRYKELEHVSSKEKDNLHCADSVFRELKTKHSGNESTNDSSKSVILSDRHASDKEIQTSSRQNVSTAAQTSSRLMNNERVAEGNSYGDGYHSLSNILTKGPIILNVVRSGTRPVYRTKRKRAQHSAKTLNVTPPNLVHESTESDHDEEIEVNFNATSPLVIDQDDSSLKCGESLLSRAESFEYMPGHMFQNNNTPPLEDIPDVEKSTPESSLGVVSPESCHPILSSSTGLDLKDDELINIETSSCFERDLNANVNLISKLVAQRHNDPKLKKRLIKQVVKMLVKADYPEDESGESPKNSEDVSIYSSKDLSNRNNKIQEIPITEEAVVKVCPPKFEETDILLKRTAFHKQIFIKSKSSEEIATQTKPRKDIPPKECPSAPASLAVSGRMFDTFSHRDFKSKVMCDKSVQLSLSTNSSAKDSTNKCLAESYESNSVVCSSTPGYLSEISPVQQSQLTKSKSEHIYEQYLIAKRQEEIEKKQTELTNWTLVKKIQEDDEISINKTRRQLAMISNEIIRLNLLKIKLENKNKPMGGFDDELVSRDNQTVKHVPNRKVEVYTLTQSKKLPKLNVKSDQNNVHIPLLDLRKSSDESSINTLSNAEEISLQSTSDAKNDTPPRPEDTDILESHREAKNKTEIPKEPASDNVKNVADGVKSPQSLQSEPKLFARKKSEDSKRVKILYNNDALEMWPQCKCKHSRSDHFQSTTTIVKKSSKAQFQSPEGHFGIFCSCCRNNILSSSSSSESNKQSAESQSISTAAELHKLEKIFAKYEKCKVMKSFMNDYENLVLKYKKMKEKNVECDILNGSNVEGKKQKISTDENKSNVNNKHLININKKIKKFNEGIAIDEHKIELLPESHDDDRPKSAPLLLSASTFSKKVEPAIGKSGLLQRADSFERQTINIEESRKESSKCLIPEKIQEKPKPFCVDATTSPLVLYSGKTDEKLESNPKSLDLTDKFVLKVKNVVMQEYEDLAKKIDRIQDTIEFQNKNNLKNGSKDIPEDSVASKQPVKTSRKSKSQICPGDKIIREEIKHSKNRCDSISVEKAKDGRIFHSEASKSQGRTRNANKENEVLCLCPKSQKLALDLHSCNCQKRIERQKYISLLIKEAKKKAILPVSKPIAYNLILEPSESILEETVHNMKKQSLKDVIVKIPKHPGARVKDARDLKQPHRNIKSTTKSYDLHYNEGGEKGSTDEQIKEFSSLDGEFSDRSSASEYSIEGNSVTSSGISSRKENNQPKMDSAKKKSMSVEEYLRVNKPTFIDEADKRRECLRRLHILRRERDAQRRRVLSLGVSNLPNIKDISTSDLHHLAEQYGITFSHTGKSRIFNSHDMVKNTARQYKKLPEIQSKKQDLKKQQSKKTNLLMAELFAKKLRERALKGVVNISHSSNVVTI